MYIGNTPDIDAQVLKYEYTATAGQTVFNCSYDNTVDVHINGVLLATTDYTATTGTEITLLVGATLNDEVQINGYKKFFSADHYDKTASDARFLSPTGDGSGLSGINTDLVSDTTPQLGGDLDFQTHKATSFTSTGIDDNATSTAITIDASENVGIGAAPESGISGDVVELDMGLMSLSMWKGESQPNDSASYGYNCYKTGSFAYKAKKTSTGADNRPVVYEQAYGTHKFRVGAPGAADAAITWTDALQITNDGRGLSQFTAKAWVNFTTTGGNSIRDSHSISSVNDLGTGQFRFNMSSALANASYSIAASVARTRDTGNYHRGFDCWAENTSSFRFITMDSGTALTDYQDYHAVVFGD